MSENSYFLLFSHSIVIFPMAVCFWKYKISRDYQALYLLFQLLYTACFSVVFHTYDYAHVSKKWDPEGDDLFMWRFLDYVSSRTAIFTNIAYAGRFRTEIFYLLSHLAMIIFMLLEFKAPSDVIIFINVILCVLIAIIKIKTLFLYFKFFWIHTVFSFLLLGSGLFCLFSDSMIYDYKIFHSLWHLLVFSASGSACIIRYRLDLIKPLEEEPQIYRRPPSDSL